MINCEAKQYLLDLYREHNIMLEGNILKIITIDEDEDIEFKEYIEKCISTDKDKRKMRLEITKKVQQQNKELQVAKEEIERINDELKDSLSETQKAKESVEYDLDVLQKKKQTELTGKIVKSALYVIMGVGIITTLMYILAIFTGQETQVIGSTWSNLTGILLTNAFSIVGTIMGVKHLNESTNKEEKK
jgi:Fe2+ transport system protein B